LGNHEKAKECLEYAVRYQPDLTDAYYALATVCTRLQLDERAAECRQRFQQLKQADREKTVALDAVELATAKLAMTYYDAGRLFRGYGNLQKAEEHWLKAAALEPMNVRCREALMVLYQGSNRLGESLEICRQLHDIVPDRAQYHAYAALLNSRMTQFDAAASAIERAVELDPDNADYQRLAAQIRQRVKTE